jgi:hypothetical protein
MTKNKINEIFLIIKDLHVNVYKHSQSMMKKSLNSFFSFCHKKIMCKGNVMKILIEIIINHAYISKNIKQQEGK